MCTNHHHHHGKKKYRSLCTFEIRTCPNIQIVHFVCLFVCLLIIMKNQKKSANNFFFLFHFSLSFFLYISFHIVSYCLLVQLYMFDSKCMVATIINNNHNHHHVEQENFTITYDSDGDEFTDTIDSSFSPQHQQVPKIFCNTFNDDDHDDDSIINAHHHSNNNVNNQNMSSLVGEKNSSIINNRSESKTINQSSSSVAAAAAAPPPNVLLDFNEQLAVAIFQLQNSLDRITNRVHKLEQQQQQQQQQVTIRQQQQSSISGINDNNQNNNGWPFRELRPQTTLFILTWPMAVFFLLNYLQRIRKK